MEPPTLTQVFAVSPLKNISEKKFVYDSSKPLEGVIAPVTRECRGNVSLNVHGKEIIDVTASSVYENTSFHQPKNAVNLGTSSIYWSNNEKELGFVTTSKSDAWFRRVTQ